MYDMIIVGSGNGACGFLSCYLEANAEKVMSSTSFAIAEKILVLEEGQDFFSTSDITHQKGWSKSYLSEEIYKLHRASTPEGTPIVTGRACTMGGGGSLNYTMIHESSEWLAKQLGRTKSYWDDLKQELNQKFERSDPSKNQSSVTKHVLEKARAANFQLSSTPAIHNIVNHQEGNADLLHVFTTQFNQFGQRTNSGVSIVDWNDPRIELKTHSRVVELKFSDDEKPVRCVGVNVKNIVTGEIQLFSLTAKSRLILCAGAATPRLLIPHRDRLQNQEIGQHINDHIAIPLGAYILDSKTIDATQRDNYLPVFATTVWTGEQEKMTCTFDFFAGDLPELLYFFPQLYFPFLVPNWLEKIAIANSWLFYLIKNLIKELIRFINLLINLWWSFSNLLKGKSWRHRDLPLITAVLKFSAAKEGYYLDDGQVRLRFFSEDESHFNQDKEVAKYAIRRHLAMINTLGQQPSWVFKCFSRLITKIPYEENQIDRYVEATSKYFLSTEQHLSGGCIFDKAIALGLENNRDTGKVYGSANVYVADLSAVPLPRVSTQMTAYLVGFHVAKMLCSDRS